MRRSQAPSRFSYVSTSAGAPSIPAGAEGVVQILQSKENHIKELEKIVKPSPGIHFSVVFGKKSTKKHKTYDEDGTIEVKNTAMFLKNSSGRYLGSGNATKQAIIEGGEISISGYDVLVGEQIEITPAVVALSPKMTKMAISRVLQPAPLFKARIQMADVVQPKPTPMRQMKFTVVWGPVSTKKHKTWEGDGTLEITGSTARLRDERGKLLATDYKLKDDELAEGSRLVMEGKELEIIEVATANFIERTEVRRPEPPSKYPRIALPFKPPTILDVLDDDPPGAWSPTYSPTSPEPPAVIVCEPLASQFEIPETGTEEVILPTPPYDHQMKHNTQNIEVKQVVIPVKLGKLLRPHQRQGVIFLYEAVMGFHTINQVDCYGAILADEMGLGKTIQCITLMYILLKQGPYGQPVANNILIVTPSSLVDNWKQEIVKWLEHERIYSFEVSSKHKPHEFVRSRHVPIMIVSYEMFVKQHEEINEIPFDLMICDEGHRLKNSTIKAATLLDQSSCRRRIILSGTPIQNDLEEFYSLINFVNPNVLGTYAEYKVRFETPIVHSQQAMVLPQYKELGEERAAELSEITNRFFLRRTQDINQQYLPPKQEVVIFCQPSELQQLLIVKILEAYSEQRFLPLPLITCLKKICNHPLLLGETDFKTFLPPVHKIGMFDSVKVELVYHLLTKIFRRNEKVVLVSYFNQTLNVLEELCRESQFVCLRLDGTTPAQDRSKIVKSFNDPASNSFIFLLSAKAGGAGLNLIGASRLILFDNDWNPATDLQAMSRIWRDGQTRPVYIYRLLTCGTIEEKIFQRQASKTSLGGRVMEHAKHQEKAKFSDEELRDLFSVPTEFRCLTHESINCGCEGKGEVPASSSQELTNGDSNEDDDDDEDNPYKIKRHKKKKNKKQGTLQMHELMRYEHHAAPVADLLLDELCLSNARELLSFIFRSQVSGGRSQEVPEAPTMVSKPTKKWAEFLGPN